MSKDVERQLKRSIKRHDYDALRELSVELHRTSDPAMALVWEAMWEALTQTYAETPTARGATLIEELTELRESPEAQALRNFEKKNVPFDDWLALLRGDLERDLGAVLATLHRAGIKEIRQRATDLSEALADAKMEPRVSGLMLKWLVDPPFRSTGSQPIWVKLFKLMLAQTDPRVRPEIRRLAKIDFPAGSSMQGWMAEQLARMVKKFDANPIEEPLETSGPTDLLDACATILADVKGVAFIDEQGEVATRSLEPLLETVGSRPLTANLDAEPTSVSFTWPATDELGHVTSEGFAIGRDDDIIVVYNAARELVWSARRPEVHAQALSEDGRYVALLVHGSAIELIERETGEVRTREILTGATSRHRMSSLDSAGAIVFDEDNRVWATFSRHDPTGGYVAKREISLYRWAWDEDTAHLVYRRASDRDESTLVIAEAPHAQIGFHPSKPTVVLLTDGGVNGSSFVFELDLRDTDHCRARFAGKSTPNPARLVQAYTVGHKRALNIDNDKEMLLFPAQTHGAYAHVDRVRFETGALVREDAPPKCSRLRLSEQGYATPKLDVVGVSENGTTIVYGIGAHVSSTIIVQDLPGHDDAFSFKADGGFLSALALSPDGLVVYGAASRNLYGHTIKVGKKIPKPKRVSFSGHKDGVRHIDVHPDGRLVTSADDGVLIWKPDTTLVAEVRGLASQPRRARWAPSGELIAASSPLDVWVVDATDGSVLATHEVMPRTHLEERTENANNEIPIEWLPHVPGSGGPQLMGIAVGRAFVIRVGEELTWLKNAPQDLQSLVCAGGQMFAVDSKGALWTQEASKIAGDTEWTRNAQAFAAGPTQVLTGGGALFVTAPKIGSDGSAMRWTA